MTAVTLPAGLDVTLPPRPLGPLPPAVLAAPVAALFGALAALRGRRALHPRGRTFSAGLAVPPSDDLPAAWRALDGAAAVVRFSRGAGLPAPLPDVLGIAVRVGAQDLLFSSSSRRSVLRRLPLPARGPRGRWFSSLAPYTMGAARVLLLATVDPASRVHMEAVRRRRRVPLGTLTLGAALEGRRPRFDPWRAGAGLVPVGLLQRLRSPAYAASRRAA